MVLRRLVFGMASALLAGTALAQSAGTGIQPYAPPQGSPQGEVKAFSPTDFRRETQAPSYAPPSYAQPANASAQPAAPVYAPSYAPPAETRQTPQAAAPQAQQQPAYTPDYRPRQTETRPTETRPNAPDGQRAVQDFRPATVARPAAQPANAGPAPAPVAQPAAAPAERFPVYEAKPGVIDPRVIVPRKSEYIEYKAPPGGTLDFRPNDFRPVDERTMEYRSQNHKTPDQKVLDPRLKEKGPEQQTIIDCKALGWRAVECNFLDYREIDPALQERFARYPEVAFGVVPKEYSREQIERWQPLLSHVSAQLGLKVTLKIANDYQALMDAQKAGLVHIAIYSPVAFARARMAGVKTETFAVEANADGARGSHAIIYALAKSGAGARPEDMRGKSIGLVDPNSISGFFVPRMMLSASRIDPETGVARQLFTGSHENALAALSQGLVDFAVGQWSSEEESTLTRMLAKGMLKGPDGNPLRREDFRVVAKSDVIANPAIAYLADLPEDLKGAIRRAMLEAPMRDKPAFERAYEGRTRWEPAETKAYDGTIELVKSMDAARAAAAGSAAATTPQKQASR